MITLDHIERVEAIPAVSQAEALRMIDESNLERQIDAEAALGNGDMDDFRYRLPRWLLLKSNQGDFVATIKAAGGGGRVTVGGDPGDYCDSFIEYALHARVAA